MTKEQKLDAIYEAIADKTLSHGCTYQAENNIYTLSEGDYVDEYNIVHWSSPYENYEHTISKIIGHPVRIGDVFDYITVSFFEKDLYWYRVSVSRLIPKWDKPRLPINAQSEECIDFVYSLIQK